VQHTLLEDPTDDTEVTEEPGQQPNQNDNRQYLNTVENRGSGEDGILRPQDIEVKGELTDLQRWLGLKEYVPQVISQCLVV